MLPATHALTDLLAPARCIYLYAHALTDLIAPAVYQCVLPAGLQQRAQDVQQTVLDLDLKKRCDARHMPEAYEKLIHDVLQVVAPHLPHPCQPYQTPRPQLKNREHHLCALT